VPAKRDNVALTLRNFATRWRGEAGEENPWAKLEKLVAEDPLISRGLPANPMAEAATIGAVLLDNRCWYQVEHLPSAAFSVDANRRIWEAFKALRTATPGIPLDFTTLVERLLNTKELDSVGGPTYLGTLTDGLPRAINAEAYAKIVKDKWTLRRLIQSAHNIVQEGLDGGWSDGEENISTALDSFLSRAESIIMGVRPQEGGGPLPIAEVIPKLRTMLGPQGKPLGISTGFASVDNIMACGGWPVGELNILGGFSQSGKTALMTTMARHSAESGKVTVIFSMETMDVRIALRMACQTATVNIHQALRRGDDGRSSLDDWLMGRLEDAMLDLAKLPIIIDETSGLSAADIQSRCRRIKAERGSVGAIWIDYLQLMGDPPGRFGTRNDSIAETNRILKSIAKEMPAPIIALSQLTNPKDKQGPPPRPTRSMLRDSGTIGEQAYNIGFLHREPEQKDRIVFILDKNKDADTGEVELGFNGQYMQFGEAPPKEGRVG
jgi:replicative DNA helicase